MNEQTPVSDRDEGQAGKKAVALRYDSLKDPAPRVVAKGRGLVAEKILEIARREGIPVREDPDLLEALAQIELDQVIPPQLYQAVAEVLAFLYRLNAEQKRHQLS